jgi:hypothetical protein
MRDLFRRSDAFVAVTLVEMSGVEHHVNIKSKAAVSDLKLVAAPVLLVPAEFQKLIADTTVMEDCESIEKYLADDAQKLMVTFAFCDGGVLTHESIAARRAALESLAKVAHSGRRQVVRVLLNFSEDTNDLCRHAAVLAMGQIAHLADEQFLEVVTARLLDRNPLIAAAAVNVLGNAAEAGNDEATSCLLQFLEVADEQDSLVQLAVMEQCGKLPERHKRRVIRSLHNIFRASKQLPVQIAARNTHANVARRGQSRASCTF